MIYEVYSVYDKSVGAYLPPFHARAKGEALRMFTEACNDPKSNFAKYALDYTLVHLGTFDDSTGLYACSDPVRVLGANEVVVDPVLPPDREVKPPRAVM